MHTASTDNALVDWYVDASRGDSCCYYSYPIKRGVMLCSQRQDDREVHDVASKAWAMYISKIVTLVQQRDDETVRYVAIKR